MYGHLDVLSLYGFNNINIKDFNLIKDEKKPVVLLLGFTGSGKSSLINYFSKEEVAEVNNVTSETREFRVYETDDFYLIDSEGYETNEKHIEDFKKNIISISRRLRNRFVVWYCLPITKESVENIDKEIINKLDKNTFILYTKLDEDSMDEEKVKLFDTQLNLEKRYKISLKENIEGNDIDQLVNDTKSKYSIIYEDYLEKLEVEKLKDMKQRIKDEELKFLVEMTSEELKGLSEIILYGNKNKEKRLFLYPSTDKCINDYDEDYSKYIDKIYDEYISYGGNTFSNLFFSKRDYVSILEDVLKNQKIEYNKYESVEDKENKLLNKILNDLIKNKEFSDELKKIDEVREILESEDFRSKVIDEKLMMIIIQQLLKQSGFAAYKFSVIIANYLAKTILGRGLSLGINATITKSLSYFLSGPVTVILFGWQIYDVSGPAYRVTVPSTTMIACLRKIWRNKNENQ